MTDPVRPSFIEEQPWNEATDAQRLDWARYARDLAEILEDPRVRNVVGRWVDEFAGVFAATLELAECGMAGHAMLMALREGRRQVGIQIVEHARAVAPKMWMRTMHEMRTSRTRVEMGLPEQPEETNT